MTSQQIAVLVVAGTLGLLVLLLLVYGRPRRSRQEPLPATFSRGDPDSVLESSRLHKLQVWALAGSVFCAGFLAIYLVAEPFREANYTQSFLDQSVERGELIYTTQANCQSCHGPDGSGGFAATNTDWPAPPLNNEFHRYTRNEIRSIIERGRPGTPMPAWAVEFGGPLNDQKVDDVVNFIFFKLTIPKDKRFELATSVSDGRKVFEQKCASCHGPQAMGQAMGKPLPSFYAPDLTTEFYRLGIGVLKVSVAQELFAASDGKAPSAAEVDAAIAKLTTAEVRAAGESAVRNTILNGRTNTPMPAWKNRIMPEQIDAVISYLKSIQRDIPGGQQ